MPQDVFESAVSTVTVGHISVDKPREEIAADLWIDYADLLADDPVEIVCEMAETSQESVEMFRRLSFSDSQSEQILGFLHHFTWFCRTFDERNKRRGFRLFNGIWFTAPRIPETNRKARYMKRFGLYLIGMQTGTVPLAPVSWTPF